MDVHAASIVVVRMVDGAKPQPPQTSPAQRSVHAARKKQFLINYQFINEYSNKRVSVRVSLPFANSNVACSLA
jgi:hypothetical protein